MIYMLDQQVHHHLDKGAREFMMLSIQRCLDNRARNIWQCTSNVLVVVRRTTVILRGNINMVFQARLNLKVTRSTKEQFQECQGM